MNLATALERIRAEAAPCVRLVSGEARLSKIGGVPDLRAGFSWPSRNGRSLSFLAQIDLGEVRAARGPDWLSDRGTLFFFYDEEGGAWGFSPEDRGSVAVLYDEDMLHGVEGRAAPEPAPPVHPPQAITMLPHLSMPTPERLAIDTLNLKDAEWRAIDDLVFSTDGDSPRHQIGGWPHPIQNDNMELESQLASNGVDCGSAEGYSSDAAEALAPGAAEWRLLLQLDSDDASDMMWGDSGILYFWIREADARAGDFSKAWMILQCC